MRLKINFNNLKWITDYYKNFRLRQRGKGLKTCSKCGEVRGIGDFVKNRRYKDGLSSVCRACRSAYNRERYLVRREEILKQTKAWRAKNKEKKNFPKNIILKLKIILFNFMDCVINVQIKKNRQIFLMYFIENDYHYNKVFLKKQNRKKVKKYAKRRWNWTEGIRPYDRKSSRILC